MNYQIEIHRDAYKAMNSLPVKVREQIERVIEMLICEPMAVDSKPLKGKHKGTMRARSGDYRIFYQVKTKERVVAVLKVFHRREAYR
jgi:addiction module RelE/StbE family toxin